MARKHLLDHLITLSEPAAEVLESNRPSQRKSGFRGVGVVGAMSESFELMAADLKAAQDRAAQVAQGDIVIEVETDLIDPSFVSDRLGDGSDLEQLVSSIREFGQQAPILLRPHPEISGRYQIAYGHRRFRALKSLGRPVKAIVKPLSNDDLVIAQGQENQNRRDLSFIERALFASRLENQNFRREVICSALAVDKTELSRMISITATLPLKIIEAIGPAIKTGRRRWLDLAKLAENLDWSIESQSVLRICRETAADSDGKFNLVLQNLSAPKQGNKSRTDAESEPAFVLQKKRGVIRILFDEPNLPKHIVDECVSKVREICNSYGAKT